MEVLGLLEQGGVTRVGVSLYTLEEEIDRLIASVRMIARS
jgi:selenocysteine lyase/cysteine desulfurase